MSKIFYTNIDLKKNQLENAKIHHLSDLSSTPVVGQLGEYNNVLYMGVDKGEGVSPRFVWEAVGGVNDVKISDGTAIPSTLLDENKVAQIRTDGTYNASTNKIATESTVTTAIEDLDVTGYAQGGITTSSGSGASTITIKGIQEVDGKISNHSGSDATISVDGEYDASTNKIATQSTVTTAINALDTQSDVAVATADTTNHTVTINGSIKEEDGIIADGTAADVTLYFASEQSSTNKIVTEAEIADLSGAMHFRSVITTGTGSGQDYVTLINDYYTQTTPEIGDVFVDSTTGKEYVVKSLPQSGDLTAANIEEFGSVNPDTTVASVTASTQTTGLTVTPTTATTGAVTITVDATSGYQIPTTAQMTKVDNIAVTLNDATDGNKVTDGTNTLTHIVSDANYAHITVTNTSVSDGTTTFNKYVHPTTTAATAAAVKVGNDSEGHVVLGAALTGSDIEVTSAPYGGSTDVTDAQSALNNLASAISSASIKIDNHVGNITTGDGLTHVTANGGSFGVKIDSSNANGLSVGANGIAMAKATGSSFGTVEVTAGNGLTLTDGVVAYAHNTTAITVASESNGVVTINGTLTPDASDSITASNSIALAKVATTGAAADVSITDSGDHFTATTVEGALSELYEGYTNAIAGLDASTVATVTSASASSGTGTTFTFKGVKEADGVIAQGEGTDTFTVGDGALKLSGYAATDTTDPQNPSIDAVSATEVFGANDTADSTLALSNAFVLDATNKTIGLRTNQAVSASNNIATMNDIASLSGAMHYMGGVTAYPTPTTTTKAGDTYIVTQRFEYLANSGTIYEVGDMLVANADGTSATYNVVQSNLTLGVNQGQVAPNSAALTSGNIVVASGTGIETSSYTVANLASQATTVASTTGGVTITDTLTVGGTAQTGQTVTLVSANNAIAVSNSDNTITLTHITPSNFTAPSDAAVKITTDAYGHITATSALVAGDINFDVTGTGITPTGGSGSTATVQEAITQLDSRITSSTAIFHVDSSAVSTATSGMYVWTLTITAASGFNAKNDATVSVRDSAGNEVECDKTLSGTTITLKFSEAITAGEFTAVVVAKNTATNVQ